MKKRVQLLVSVVACFIFLNDITAQIPEGYYNSIDGKKGAALKTALSRILVNHTVLSYDNLWYYFRTTDNRGSDVVWDMYSNTTRYFSSGSRGVSGMEREHSLPKSWWAIESEVDNFNAYSDLNHLYPSDGTANGAKSNYILGTNNGNILNGVSKVGTNNYPGGAAENSFEPDGQYKGDFARTYLYMVTCYEDYAAQWRSNGLSMLDKNTYPVLKTWAKNMLLQWSTNDPVSSKETDRNEEVFRYQGNRNPFIDFPQLAQYIWGDSINYEFHLPDQYKPKEPVVVTPVNLTDVYFGEKGLGSTTNEIVNVKGVDLSGSLSVMLYGTNKSMFSISSNTISAATANAETGYNLTVSYLPTAYGKHSANLTIYDGGISGSISVQLNGVCTQNASIVPVGALSADIYTSGNKINFRTFETNTPYFIYTIQGVLLAKGEGSGQWEAFVCPGPGIYVVRINNQTTKVIVNGK